MKSKSSSSLEVLLKGKSRGELIKMISTFAEVSIFKDVIEMILSDEDLKTGIEGPVKEGQIIGELTPVEKCLFILAEIARNEVVKKMAEINENVRDFERSKLLHFGANGHLSSLF